MCFVDHGRKDNIAFSCFYQIDLVELCPMGKPNKSEATRPDHGAWECLSMMFAYLKGYGSAPELSLIRLVCVRRETEPRDQCSHAMFGDYLWKSCSITKLTVPSVSKRP